MPQPFRDVDRLLRQAGRVEADVHGLRRYSRQLAARRLESSSATAEPTVVGAARVSRRRGRRAPGLRDTRDFRLRECHVCVASGCLQEYTRNAESLDGACMPSFCYSMLSVVAHGTCSTCPPNMPCSQAARVFRHMLSGRMLFVRVLTSIIATLICPCPSHPPNPQAFSVSGSIAAQSLPAWPRSPSLRSALTSCYTSSCVRMGARLPRMARGALLVRVLSTSYTS